MSQLERLQEELVDYYIDKGKGREVASNIVSGLDEGQMVRRLRHLITTGKWDNRD